ncbi:MAG: hypothetical protein J7599_12455 [Niabella sp.]|nr:hypothetical protein [Niabella sp.]
MSAATIYRIKKKGYLLYSSVKTVSGFWIAAPPYFLMAEDNANSDALSNAIRAIIKNDDPVRVPDPKDWKEFNREFENETGVSSKDLNRSTTMCCDVSKKDSVMIFTPTKHAEKPDRGFLHKRDEEKVSILFTASDQEIYEAFMLAFSRCE